MELPRGVAQQAPACPGCPGRDSPALPDSPLRSVPRRCKRDVEVHSAGWTSQQALQWHPRDLLRKQVWVTTCQDRGGAILVGDYRWF